MGFSFKSITAPFNPSQWGGDSDPVFGGSVGDMIPGIGDARAAEKANKENVRQAELNREFQERMANTAYQRAMGDMRSAGLNPTLAYMQGGAATPSGGAATVQAAPKTALLDKALQAYTGISAVQQKATALEQQQSLNDSSIKLNASQAAKNVADAARSAEETKGLGRKASEGNLWNRFYKGIENVLDSSSKDAARRNKSEKPLIKVLGPADKKQSSMFQWLQGKKPH